MSAGFAVTCAYKAFCDWIAAIESVAESEEAKAWDPGKVEAIAELRKACDMFGMEFKDNITD